jgi:hypothetical protein
MKRLASICLLLACAATAPAATAQSSSSTLITFGSFAGGRPVSTTTIPAETSGQLAVSFHGDPATGCAAQGICGYRGTVVFRPGSQGEFAVSKYRVRGRSAYQVQLNLGTGPEATTTAARVMRVGGGECGDVEQPNAALTTTVSGGEVATGLIQPHGNLLTTRCAGPLDADLAGLGPQIRLTLGELLRGRRTVSLSGTWSFAAGGFAGTIDSSLRITLGKPSTQRLANHQSPRGIKTRRERQVTETLTLVGESGSLSQRLGSDPTACQFVDSCGVQGSLNGTFAPSQPTASVFVTGPATRPYRDFLAVLGLSRRGNPRGLLVFGSVAWQGGGSLTEQLQQDGTCTSSAPLPGGVVVLGVRGRRLTETYSPAASPRTRCPGPELAQFQTLASGGIGLAALAQPTFTLHLSGSGPLADDGYTISQHTSLTLTLKRGRVREHTLLSPAP